MPCQRMLSILQFSPQLLHMFSIYLQLSLTVCWDVCKHPSLCMPTNLSPAPASLRSCPSAQHHVYRTRYLCVAPCTHAHIHARNIHPSSSLCPILCQQYADSVPVRPSYTRHIKINNPTLPTHAAQDNFPASPICALPIDKLMLDPLNRPSTDSNSSHSALNWAMSNHIEPWVKSI